MKKQMLNDITLFKQEHEAHIVTKDMQFIFDNMEAGLQRVNNIVQNLSILSATESNTKQFSNVNNCIDSSYKKLSKKIKDKANIRLSLNELPETEINESKINQVLINLITNASQAMQVKGLINITSQILDNKIVVKVIDNGCGIESHVQKKIFDPFYTTKNSRDGTGLGLAIAYDIVKEHMGELRMTSVLNVGTTFTLTLPITKKTIH